ncbi:hypothetical protein SLS58_007347 [Diplodia intermedia]|uniref:Uncharacterized protein n=1 Tax=Diplodia intermedia TaxID=856260 RepID=A0ABR3TKT9_9PEZI
MAVCIPWLLFWMCLRGIVWVLTCGHYGFNDMAKKKKKGNAQEERRAAIESIAQLAEFIDKRNNSSGGGASNRRNDVDLEAQDNIQPAARSKTYVTYHEALAEVQQNKPHADGDAIELETMRTDGQGNAKDNLTSEEREAAWEEARRLKAKEAQEAEEKAAKEAEEEARNRENPWVWPEGSKAAVEERYY